MKRAPQPQRPVEHRVDLADPAARAGWLADMHEHIADMAAAGMDATAPLAKRDLGRRVARRIIRDAERVIAALLTAAGYVPGQARNAGSAAPEQPAPSTTHRETSPESKPEK